MVFAHEPTTALVRQLLTLVLGIGIVFWAASNRFEVLLSPESTPDAIAYQTGFPFQRLVILALLPLILLISEMFLGSEDSFRGVSLIVFGLIYIAMPFAALQFIYCHDDRTIHPHLVMGMLLLVWANDSFAYLIGSRIGKTPLLPRVSPKKTWEGSLGGVLFTFLTGGILYLCFGELSIGNWMMLALIVATFGSLGDLVESMLKRSVGVKDSGNIMPGHGGMLDRFDAFMFMLPFAAAYLWWVG
jgi:phosphatidate cytidylyltransferase